MKTYLQKLMATAVLGLALVSNSIPTWAGSVSIPEIEVGGGIAIGSIAGTRYSADNQQYVGCSLSNTNGPFVMCSAIDKTGESLVCTSTDPGLAAVVKTITDFSWMNFATDSDKTSCAFLQIENASYNLK